MSTIFRGEGGGGVWHCFEDVSWLLWWVGWKRNKMGVVTKPLK